MTIPQQGFVVRDLRGTTSEAAPKPFRSRKASRDTIARLDGRPITLKRIMDGEPPTPPRLAVDRLILAEDVNLFGGHGDAGKSTTLYHLAVCFAIGRPAFGTLNIPAPGAVALLVPEDGEAVARHHLDAIAVGLELTDVERDLMTRRVYIVGDDRPVNLLTDTCALAALLDQHSIAMLIGDPVANLIGGEKEDDESVASRVCDEIRRNICRPLDCAVILAHHLRKPSREAADADATAHDFKGSAGWVNHSRQVWAVSKAKGSAAIRLKLVKSNRLRTGSTFDLTLDIDADPENEAHWLACRLTDANAGAVSQHLTPGVGRRINDNEAKALSSLDDRHEPGRRVSWSEWTATSGIKPDTLKSIKRRLLEAGLADAIPAGEHRNGGKLYNYAISDRGRMALDTGWTSEALKGERVR